MSSSATGVGMPICFLGAILLILTQKSSQKFGDVLGIMSIIINSRKLSFLITQNSAFYCARMLIANPPPATEFNFKTDLLVTVFLVMT